jgi:formate dehydrogenase (coenzyme F420) beta subunit
MSIKKQENEIKTICKKLMEEGEYKLILGFAPGGEGNCTSAHFIRSVQDVDKLIWDESCVPNLAKYLLEKKEPVAIVAKPCDARAVSMYIAEGQKKREDVYIIGVECTGMKDVDGQLLPACTQCDVRTPPIFDVIVKNDELNMENKKDEAVDKKDDVPESNDKFTRLEKELEKCILCFSCRQACYGCYCETCFMDRGLPDWLPGNPDMSTKMLYHLGRAMHLAGRCVGCGACQNACPSGVDIRYLVKELADYCEELYGYVPGMNPDEKPAMSAFDADDGEPGFLGHENDQEA